MIQGKDVKLRSLMFLICLFGAVTAASPQENTGAKNVILFIGDGLGAGQMALGIRYARMVEGRELNLEQLMSDGNTGYALASAYGSQVTDSAAAASQLATGIEARNETLGLNPSGYRTETILEWAEGRGLATGIVTNMRLSHATPAAFAAHVISRYEPEPVILDQMLFDHDVDVFLGGGARALVPAGHRVSEFLPGVAAELDGDSYRLDERDRISEAKEMGYTVVSDRHALAQASRHSNKLLGLFAASNVPYVVDTRAMGLDGVPSLKDSTAAALEVLARSEAGFFLMVEGGRIDYGGHDNDAGAMLHEILDFDAALGAGITFQRAHPETLIIVTADHGTGGFTFTYGDVGGPPEPQVLPSGLSYRPGERYPEKRHLELLRDQSASFLYMLAEAAGSPEHLIETVREHTGLSMTMAEAREALVRDAEGNAWLEESRHFYDDPASNPAALLARALARQTFVVWSTGGHTSGPVLTFGRGPGAEGLRGIYENTHVHEVMKDALAARPQETAERFQWPSFRGPSASGVADGQNPPTAWDPETGHNVLWSTAIPGLGHSSPIVWGDRIFLTTAVSDDADFIFRYGTDGRQDRRSDRARNAWFVYAIHRRSGDMLWIREAINGNPIIQRHPKNSYASATPATDGEHVVVLVATGGLFCYDFDGELLWDLDLGPFDAGASYDDAYQWGAASSPIIWQDTVIVQADQQEGSFIAAFNIDTGKELWRTPRDLISSFSTPTIHVGTERTELVTNGAGTMHGYDPASGEELWRMSGSSLNTTPTPVSDGELLYVTSGYRTRPIFAIRAGATGDISLADDERSNANVAWSSPREGPYIASPLVYRGYLYVVSANGVLTVFDATTGERAYKRRIGDTGGAYSASPIAADGRLYLTSEDGDIFVVKAGPEYELLAVNRMGEVCLATPAISEGQMYIRTIGHLLAVTDGIAPAVAAAEEPSSTPFPAALAADLELPFDSFEDGDLFANTDVRWQTFTNGVSAAALRLVDGGAAGTAAAARLDGELVLGAAHGPLAQMYQPFDRGSVPISLENLGGIRFYARGCHPFELTIRCRPVEFGKELEVSEEWGLVELTADELAQIGGPSPAAEWSGANCDAVYFSRRGDANVGEFWFEVDEITFYGVDAWDLRDRSPR